MERVLESLSLRYRLFMVSNCRKGYMEAFFFYHELGRFIEDTECAGEDRKAEERKYQKLGRLWSSIVDIV